MYVFSHLLAVSCHGHILTEQQEVKKCRGELAGDRVCSSKVKIGGKGNEAAEERADQVAQCQAGHGAVRKHS